jgi:hypothetical protein
MCHGEIAREAAHVRCSVTSCNAGRMKLRFCSVRCWEKHIPTARHRQASYVEVEAA